MKHVPAFLLIFYFCMSIQINRFFINQEADKEQSLEDSFAISFTSNICEYLLWSKVLLSFWKS